MKKQLTSKQKEILDYIFRNSGIQVEMSPRTIKQNRNFYFRMDRLVDMGAVVVQKRNGLTSLYTITNVGLELLHKTPQGFAGTPSEFTKKPSPIEEMRSKVLASKLDCSTKEELLRVLG